jgi:hypothetical protein
MKMTFTNKLILGFSLLSFGIYGIIYACAGYEWDPSYGSNYTPETFVDKSYSPLFLSGDMFYGVGHDNEHNSRFNDEIVQDWTSYFEGSLDSITVRYFLIESNANEVAQLQTFFTTKKSNATSLKWAKKIDINNEKLNSFISFLALSKKIEKVSVNIEESWSDEPLPEKKFYNPQLLKTFENKYNTTSDAFLKNRYWFQVLKGYFYSGDNENILAFFQKTENTVPKNTLYYRGLAYVAGVNYKYKRFALSNYQYSQVFDHCPTMRMLAAYCFHPQEQADWNQSLAIAKTNKEKAALWAIHGYYGNEEKAIEKIADLDANSEHLDYLLTRLINHQETKLSVNFNEKTVFENKKQVKADVNQSALALVSKIANSNITKPYMWRMACGYLETLNGNYDQAEINFEKAENQMPKTSLSKNQLRLLRFVNNLSRIDEIDATNENTIINDLKWLYDELSSNEESVFRYQNASSWSKSYLSALYKAKNNYIMSELFVSQPDFYKNENNLQLMKTFLMNKNPSEMEKIGASIYSINLKDINQFQAVRATFDNQIQAAIDFMLQTDSLQNAVLLGNPFNGSIKDCHDCDHAAYQKIKYTHIDFLNKIKLMQDNLANGLDVYNNNMLLGNAFYNITHFGNARLFYQIKIALPNSPEYNCKQAKMYYKKALESAVNLEQIAKCNYMLAKCERNDFYNQQALLYENPWDAESETINFKEWKGFNLLKNQCSSTKFYQDVIRECGYFKTYLMQQ